MGKPKSIGLSEDVYLKLKQVRDLISSIEGKRISFELTILRLISFWESGGVVKVKKNNK